jgi:hypothetical protein
VSVIEVELHWEKTKRTTKVEIHLYPDQGGPLETYRDVPTEQAVHEIDGFVLRSPDSLVVSLAAWARRLSSDNQVVHARCLESRADDVVTFLDPDNTGARPIPVDIPSGEKPDG